MSYQPHANFAHGIVLTPPSPAISGTSLTMQAGQGASFPSPATTAYNVVLSPPAPFATPQNSEIVQVTALSTDTMTIVRGQESSSAQSVTAGYTVTLTPTVKTFTDLENAFPNGAWTAYTPTFANFTIGNGTIVAEYVQLGQTVHAQGLVTLGSTSSMSTNPSMTLPVASASSGYSATQSIIGSGDYNRNGVGDYQLNVNWQSTTTAGFTCWATSFTYVSVATITSTVPNNWAASDIFTWNITYRVY